MAVVTRTCLLIDKITEFLASISPVMMADESVAAIVTDDNLKGFNEQLDCARSLSSSFDVCRSCHLMMLYDMNRY